MKSAMAKRAAPESVPPTLTPQRGIELIRRQLEQFETIARLNSDDPEAKKWMNTTESILDGVFGKPNGAPHQMTGKFVNFYGRLIMNMPRQEFEHEYRKTMIQRKAVLESCIDQLEILAPPAAQVAQGTYQFHAEIERVSGDLFRDGHYKAAALEAYIRVIEEVKQRSGLALDGDNLMNQTFGCDGGRVPTIAFNSLASDAERDEQRGIMFLFKAIVGLRNSKAHSNRIFNDPRRAHEYLALASLLLRLLEI
jgi:uncharacterized protein (TIGR02391 family)